MDLGFSICLPSLPCIRRTYTQGETYSGRKYITFNAISAIIDLQVIYVFYEEIHKLFLSIHVYFFD